MKANLIRDAKITFRLPKEYKETLKIISKQTNSTLSDVLNIVIKEYIKKPHSYK